MGWRARSFIRQRIKNKEERTREYLTGWGHIVNLVWGEKAESWLGVWGLAD